MSYMSIVKHKEWNYVRKVILTHEKQFKNNSDFLADKLLRPTLIKCAFLLIQTVDLNWQMYIVQS